MPFMHLVFMPCYHWPNCDVLTKLYVMWYHTVCMKTTTLPYCTIPPSSTAKHCAIPARDDVHHVKFCSSSSPPPSPSPTQSDTSAACKHCSLAKQSRLSDKKDLTCRASNLGHSGWERLTPHLIGLFWQDKSARQAASHRLQAGLGLGAALQDPQSPRGHDVVTDPFGKLLDGGVRAPVTAALASQVSQSFR